MPLISSCLEMQHHWLSLLETPHEADTTTQQQLLHTQHSHAVTSIHVFISRFTFSENMLLHFYFVFTENGLFYSNTKDDTTDAVHRSADVSLMID